MSKISVLMSVYNDEDYLEKSIKSIINQTYKKFEFIITDDCSSDSSLDIIKYYASKDNRINIIQNKKNIGLTKSLNKMIEISNGDYIARMDADDISHKNRFKKQIEVFQQNKNIDFVFTNVSLIDSEGKFICSSYRPKNLKNILKKMNLINYIPHPTVMIKKNIFEKHGKYNSNFKTGQDKELWLRFINADVKFNYLDEELLFYRIHHNNISKKNHNNSNSYNLANLCISNRSKIESFKYFRNLTFKEKIIIIIKLLIPYRLLQFKGYLFRKLKNG